MEPRKAKPSPKMPPAQGGSQVWLAGLVGVVVILLLLSVLVA